MSFSRYKDPVLLLSQLIKVSSSNTQFDYKINNFFNLINNYLGLQKSILLLFNNENNSLIVHNTINNVQTKIKTLEKISVANNPLAQCLKNKQNYILDSKDIEKLSNNWQNFLNPYRNFIVTIPLIDERHSYGVLLLLDDKTHNLTGETQLIIEAIYSEITVSIRNHKILATTKKRLNVSQILSGLGKTLSSTIDINTLIHIIPKICAGVLLADGAALNILNKTNTKLAFSSQAGIIPNSFSFKRYINVEDIPNNILNVVSYNKMFNGYISNHPFTINLSAEENSITILSMPLIFQGNYKGNLLLFNKSGFSQNSFTKTPQLFNQDDLELLSVINSMVSGTIEKALAFKDVAKLAKTNESMLKYLSYIYATSSAMLNTVNYNELIWIIIKTLTLKTSFNFDKVLICFLEKDNNKSYLKSAAYWETDNKENLEENLKDTLTTFSDEEAKKMLQQGNDLNFIIPLTKDSEHILAKAAIKQEAILGYGNFNIENNFQIGDTAQKRVYAAIPMGGNNIEGIIGINNSINNQSFSSDVLAALSMLASQISLAFNNVSLYEDLKKANLSLRQVSNRLIEVEKQAAQGEMGTHLAHEIRNPLVAIGGFTNLLLKRIKDDDPLKKYPQIILQEVSRLNSVLNGVLDFAKNETGHVKSFKLEDIALQALEALKFDLEDKNLHLKISIEDNLPAITADDRQILSIFLNLISNAMQAMCSQKQLNNNTVIHVDLYKEEEADLTYVACQITDTGPGISEESLLKIFSPFFTTKTQGTGLGLAIVHKIVSRYHGHIKVLNHPEHIKDSGASFIFMFPATSDTGFHSA